MSGREHLEGFSREQLAELLEIYAKNWLAMDGVWFQSVERKLGMEEAMYHDAEAWRRFTVIEARRIKAFLGLEERPGLEGLEQALRLRFYGCLNRDEIRRAALQILDIPLSVEDTDPAAPAGFGQAWREMINSIYQPVCDEMLDEILKTRVASGVRIWKVYNMGFIVKTPNHAWGFDVRSGNTITRKFTPDQLAKLVKILDVLFLSHNHPDHIGTDLVREMVRAGKTVVRPTDDTVSELNGDPHLRNLYGRFGKAVKVDGLLVRAFPGYQEIPNREVPCCVYVVTADGITVAHNGDNQNPQPYELLEKARIKPDVMLVNSWSGFAPCLKAGQPKLALIGHEHELKHQASGRDSWSAVFKRIDDAGLATPICVIDCGESISYSSR